MARNTDPLTHSAVVVYKYAWAFFYGVLRADDCAVRALEEGVKIAEGSGDEYGLGVLKFSLGVALLYRDAAADHQRGLELLIQVRDVYLREGDYYTNPLLDLYVARENARRGDRDGAIPVIRKAEVAVAERADCFVDLGNEFGQAGICSQNIWACRLGLPRCSR